MALWLIWPLEYGDSDIRAALGLQPPWEKAKPQGEAMGGRTKVLRITVPAPQKQPYESDIEYSVSVESPDDCSPSYER